MREVKVGSVRLSPEARSNILQVMANNWISPGPFVAEFETSFSALHGCRYGVMVNSGTDALRIGLLAMKEKYGWADGAKIMVPALTFVATINTILQCNLEPFFVDVSPKDFNIDTDLLGKELYWGIKGIVPVHMFGNPCDMEKICRIAKEFNLKIMEDSCETMGVQENGDMVGSFGDIGAFSTYSCHLIQTGVGGIATTNDEELYKLMRSYMNHGRRDETRANRFTFDRIGYSSRPDEFQAAIGLSQLQFLPEAIEARRSNAEALLESLAGIEELQMLETTKESAWMMFPLVVNEKIDRDAFCSFLESCGIETRPLFPLLTQPCYKGFENPNRFPVALKASRQGFYVGCHPELEPRDITHMVLTIKDAVRHFSPKQVQLVD